MMSTLQRRVEELLASGMSEQKIRQILQNYGYTDVEIDTACNARALPLRVKKTFLQPKGQDRLGLLSKKESLIVMLLLAVMLLLLLPKLLTITGFAISTTCDEDLLVEHSCTEDNQHMFNLTSKTYTHYIINGMRYPAISYSLFEHTLPEKTITIIPQKQGVVCESKKKIIYCT